jgi:hypothetical protein
VGADCAIEFSVTGKSVQPGDTVTIEYRNTADPPFMWNLCFDAQGNPAYGVPCAAGVFAWWLDPKFPPGTYEVRVWHERYGPEVQGTSAQFVVLSPWVLHLVQGWNLVSTPIEPLDPTRGVIFPPSVASAVWEYDSKTGYSVPKEIHPKKGYWVMAVATQDVTIQGIRPTDRTIPVKVGWNLVGCVPAQAGGTCAIPPNPPIQAVWGYNNPGGYVVPPQLDEGRGYWMMSSQDTTVASAASRGASSEPTAAAAGWPLTLQLFNGAAKFLAVECWTQAAIPQRDRHAHTSHGRCREALCRGRLLASPPPSLAGADGPRGSQASPSPCLGFPYRGKPATGSEAEICPGRSETETALDLAEIRSIMRGQ